MVIRSAISEEGDVAMRAHFEALTPAIRAFARGLTGNPAEGDDLAQEALLKGWKARGSFEVGTNLRNWLFAIVRNQFYSDKRKSWRSTQLDPEMAERSLVANDNPAAIITLNEVRQALSCLPDAQREAMILVAAGGLSYEEAASITGCAAGTIKSRVSRGRDMLAAMLADGGFVRDAQPASAAFASINRDFDALRATT